MGASEAGGPAWPAYPHLIKGPYSGGEWTVLECETAASGTSVGERHLMLPKAAADAGCTSQVA
jgi:hypothetical protein